MKLITSLIVLFCSSNFVWAQLENVKADLPYREIPDYPAGFTANNVAARVIDGLGFRYYWATEGLRPEDLAFAPNGDARTTEEALTHIYDLSNVIVNATNKTPNVSSAEKIILSFTEMRRKTLQNFRISSEILKKSNENEMENFKVVFQTGDRSTEYPYWNLLNGPIADALWHTGQVVSFRRSSGNPFNSKASVFTGKLRE